MKNILIVEDDPFTQQFYSYLFSKTDLNAIQTEDGDKIFEIARNEDLQLIILDINLKNTTLNGENVDGVYISRKLKESEDTSHIPILLVTAYQKKIGSKDFFAESKADDYIVKPITDFNELLSKINKLIADE